MRIRTLLTAMLTLLAIAAATLVVAGCGGKSSGEKTQSQTTKGATTTRKLPSKAPSY